MTKEERQKWVCHDCGKDNCAYVNRGLEYKCPFLDAIMYGWDFGFSDAIDKACEGFKENTEKQREHESTDNKEKLGVLKFIRKETCCGLAEANNALLELIKVLKEHPFPIMDKPRKLKIEWGE